MRYFLSLALGLWASNAHAAYKIEQSLSGKRDGKSFAAQHTWIVDNGKFHLTVESALGKTLYLFNGRVFYVCSALSKPQMDYLKQFAVNDKTLMAKFKDGACQTVPANFLARFFLSPASAIDSIDQTEGLRVTVGVSKHAITPQSGNKKTDCSPAKREYTLTKEDKSSKVTQEVGETICVNKDINWRRNLWREVSKTVMRQSGGVQLKKVLERDHKNLDGFIHEQSATVAVVRDNEKATYNFELSTNKVSKVSAADDQFKIPKSYKIIHPDALSGVISIDAKTAEAKSAEEKSPSWIMLCAFSGSFFCLGN